MFCTKCGKELLPEVKFCTGCGARISDTEVEVLKEDTPKPADGVQNKNIPGEPDNGMKVCDNVYNNNKSGKKAGIVFVTVIIAAIIFLLSIGFGLLYYISDGSPSDYFVHIFGTVSEKNEEYAEELEKYKEDNNSDSKKNKLLSERDLQKAKSIYIAATAFLADASAEGWVISEESSINFTYLDEDFIEHSFEEYLPDLNGGSYKVKVEKGRVIFAAYINPNGETTAYPHINDNEYSFEEDNNAEKTSEYRIVVADVTWEEAYEAARSVPGGHLVTIESQEEMDTITELIEAQGYEENIFWIGARRYEFLSDYYWLYGDYNMDTDSVTFNANWLIGEPSFYDEASDTEELYVNMFYSSSENRWAWNDTVNDVISALPYYSGKVAYIIEIEE